MLRYMPHRKADPLMKFKIFGRAMMTSENNWTPFFHSSDQEPRALSRGSIYFISFARPVLLILLNVL